MQSEPKYRQSAKPRMMMFTKLEKLCGVARRYYRPGYSAHACGDSFGKRRPPLMLLVLRNPAFYKARKHPVLQLRAYLVATIGASHISREANPRGRRGSEILNVDLFWSIPDKPRRVNLKFKARAAIFSAALFTEGNLSAGRN